MEWTCRCGAFAADVDTRRGTRAVCYCPSCRAFAEQTSAADALDPAGGSDIFQVAPEQVRFIRGAENLSWMKLTEKGPLRWLTTCCNTPVANTLGTPTIPFISLQAHRLADPNTLPPVAHRVFRRHARARVPDDGRSIFFMYLSFAGRALRSRLTGGWRRNPFFGADGNPVAPGQGLVS